MKSGERISRPFGGEPDAEQSAGSTGAGHEIIDRVFDDLQAELPADTPTEPLEAARTELKTALADETPDTPEQTVADGGVTAQSASSDLPVIQETLLDRIGTSLFTLDAEGNVVHWNDHIEELTGVDREDARSMEMASQAFYPDGRRAETLADKVLEFPDSADEQFDLDRVGDESATMYQDRSTMVDRNDVERHIEFSAAPLYRDGDLVGAVEMVLDRTDDVDQRQAVEELVAELRETIGAISRGNHDVRAAFDRGEFFEEEDLKLLDDLNSLAEQLDQLSTHVAGEVEELDDSAEEVASRAREITGIADDQSETMATIDGEISNLSATVEEIASTADQVKSRGEVADDLAREGRDSAAEALETIDSVEETTTTVAEDVEQLNERVGEIDEIAAVINDIAEQTNMLALNANIEAARAGQAGEGFAVVADEVKSLAEESKSHATDIEQTIENIQSDATETIDGIEQTVEEVEDGIEEVETVMENLEEIVEAVTEASDGIEEVARATDDQAASAEEIASMVDEATAKADEVALEVEEIAEATGNQRQKVSDIKTALREYTV